MASGGEGGKFGKGNRNIGQGGDGVKGDSPTARGFDLWCESRGCDYQVGILDLTGGFAYFVKVLCFSGFEIKRGKNAPFFVLELRNITESASFI